MEQSAVSENRLDRVGEGVAVIQGHPKSGRLALVALDHQRLEGGGAFHRRGQRGWFPGHDSGGIFLQPVEETGVENHSILHHLGESAGELPVRERRQHVDVGEHPPRLPEGTDQILAGVEVDPGFSADSAVDLGDDGRGNLPHREAAGERRGDESGQIPDHAPPDRHHVGLSVYGETGTGIPEPACLGEGFRGFAGGHGDRFRRDPGRSQRFGHPRGMGFQHRRIGDQQRTGGGSGLQGGADSDDHTRADHDVVGAILARHRGRLIGAGRLL